jgi:hypothetical protein
MPQLPPLPVRTQRCCAPTSPLDPAIAPAAGPGAALLRPYIASRPRHCPRCRSGRSAAAPLLPLASRLAPLPHERWRIVIQHLVELTRRPMTGKHRLRDNVRRLGITNHPQSADATVGSSRRQVNRQLIARQAISDDHYCIARQIDGDAGYHMANGDTALKNSAEHAAGMDDHPQSAQSPLNPLLFERELGPVRHHWRRRAHDDLASLARQQLCQNASHVVVIVIVDHNPTRRQTPIHQVIGGVHMRQIMPRQRAMHGASHTVPSPDRTGRDDNVLIPAFENVGGSHRIPRQQLNIRQPGDLRQTPVDHPPPLLQSREARLARHATTRFTLRFDQRYLIAALTQRTGALQPRRARADDQNLGGAAAWRNCFGMPSAPPFLTHRRVLRATDRNAFVIAGDTDTLIAS